MNHDELLDCYWAGDIGCLDFVVSAALAKMSGEDILTALIALRLEDGVLEMSDL